MNQSGAENTTISFLRSVSVISDFDESGDEFDTLSPIAEGGDTADGEVTGNRDDEYDTLPYTTVQKPPIQFETIRENCWMSAIPVEVSISNFERQGNQVLNPNLYTINIKHGDFNWTIKRRYKHFRQLHEHLSLFRAKYSLPIPTKDHKARRKTLHKERLSVKFPLRPEALVSTEDIPKRMELLKRYLQTLLKCRLYRNHTETIKFFEVSHLSFIKSLGIDKGKESMVKKCSGGRSISIGCCGFLRNLHVFGTWNKRWLVIKDTFLAYIRPEDGYVSDVLLMDSKFKVDCGMGSTGAHHGVLISNLQRNLLIKCWTSRKAKEMAIAIKEKAERTALHFIRTNRFKAFAPTREASYAHWFVDAASHFEAVADSLEKAREEIFITDWWLSPEIYMKRPMTDGDKWRLDMILKRKADAGVKIYILLYKEVTMALGINSLYSKSTLLRLNSENIKIMRHPDHSPGGVLLWAHHEKMVVIDQKVAFLGGIDLCYGRWDTAEHKLTDLGSIQLMNPRSSIISIPDDSVFTETTVDGNISRDSVDNLVSDLSPCKIQIDITPPSPDFDDKTTHSYMHDEQHIHSNSSQHSNYPASRNIQNINDKSGDSVSTSVKVSVEYDCNRSQIPILAVVKHSNNIATIKDDNAISANNNNTITEKKKTVHLWMKNAEEKGLCFDIGIAKSKAVNDIIPNSGSEEKQSRHVTLRSIRHLDDDGEHIQVEKRTSDDNSQSSSQSQTSQSDLIKILPATPPAEKHTGMEAIAITTIMLNRLRKQEATDEDSPARRRWKKILHVKPFESVSNQEGQQNQIPTKYLLNDEYKPTRFSTIVERLKEKRESFDMPSDVFSQNTSEKNKTLQRTESEIAIDEQGLQGSTKLWIGKDYVNFIYKDFVQLHAPFTDFIERNEYPRMPWHDIGAVVYGKSARDVARHFITRWNYTKNKKFKKKTTYPLLMPRSYSKCTIPMSIKTVTYEVKSQILRSSCSWSAGLCDIEASIHTAYMHCIENSKHYIYIENQFFVTQIDDENNRQNVVLNGIGEALYRRIIRAHRSGDVFRVYVVMPLLPAFEGEFGTTSGTALQAVTNWNYASICRGPYSLIERLSKEIPDPLNYVVFCGLRKHEELNGKMMTELIYVHSKLMIVDDDTVIIGSANINDRSLLGKRDSELAVMVEDVRKTPVRVNGKEHFVGRFASSLRTTLFREHLGLIDSDEIDITDIVCDSFYKAIWIKQAAINTTVYDTVFKCVPCDFVHTFQQLSDYKNEISLMESNPTSAYEKLKEVKGHLVLLPREFLKSENLAPAIGTKEHLLPAYLWT